MRFHRGSVLLSALVFLVLAGRAPAVEGDGKPRPTPVAGAGGNSSNLHEIKSPRDMVTGHASGKRQGASTPSGPGPQASNVISGNRGTGITISGAGGNDISVTKPTDVASGKTSNLIQGNPIGTDKSGTGAAPLIVPAIQKIRETSARTQTQNQPTPAPPN